MRVQKECKYRKSREGVRVEKEFNRHYRRSASRERERREDVCREGK